MDYLHYETPTTADTSCDNTINYCREPDVINLRRVIQTYAWRRYCKSVGYLKRLTKRKHKHFFSTNWEDLKFNHSTHMNEVEEEDVNPIGLATSLLSIKQMNKKEDRHSYKSLDIRVPQVINSVQMENSSGNDAVCMFSTDKETQAKFTVEFNTCYSLGDKTNIELTVPANYVSPTNHVDCRLQLKKSSGERLKETVTWAVDAEIPIKSNQKVNATLSAQEKHTCAEFDVETVISLDKPWLTVNIHRAKDQAIVYTCLITDLHEVFRRYQGPNLCLTSSLNSVKNACHKVTFVSSGVCKIVGWDEVQVFVTTN